MTREIFIQARNLFSKILDIEEKIKKIEDGLSKGKVAVNISGAMIELPKATITGKLNAKKQELETEKAQLEDQFNNL